MRNTTLKLASLALAGFGVVMSGSALAATSDGAATDAGQKGTTMKSTKAEKTSKGMSKDAMPDHWFKVMGLVQTDQIYFSGDHGISNTYPSGSNIRRAELGAHGGMDAWTYLLRTDFAVAQASGNTRVLDAFLTYNPTEHAYVAFGQKLPSFGLENETANGSVTFLERSLPSQAFRPSYALGIFGGIHGDMLNLTASVFHNTDKVNPVTTGIGSDLMGFASRLVFAPVMDDEQVLHLGASYYYRDLHNNNNTLTFQTAPEAYVGSTFATGNGNMLFHTLTNLATRYSVYGLEAAGQWHSFNLQTEYFRSTTKENAGYATNHFQGYYAQLGYVLTGENRPYCFKSGTFHHVKPTSKDGAWEIAARYSHLKLLNKEHNTSLGLNWWLNDNVSFAANYIRAVVQNVGSADKDVDIVGLRAQFMF